MSSIVNKIDNLLLMIDDLGEKNGNNYDNGNNNSNGNDLVQSTCKNEESKEDRREINNKNDNNNMLVKTAKGCRDYNSGEMIIREKMMDIIKNNFNKFGGQSMETPIFELKSILMDKYGEDEKLIYEMANQGSNELLCLRYDLTVPLARYTAMNRKILKSPFKAARVGKVYRRDQPRMTKGRLREFWQCDFDIVRMSHNNNNNSNSLDLILDDCEVISLVCQTLIDLNIGKFKIIINNRKLLDLILNICNVPNNLMRAISSAIDKLDKKKHGMR